MTFPSFLSIFSALILSVVIALLAKRAGALSRSGAWAAVGLGTIIFGFGGFRYTVILLVFFISSSLLSRMFKTRKGDLEEKVAKGSRRDAWQVLANGALAGVFSLVGGLLGGDAWWWLFCASMAAANADTWATELGVFSKSDPRLITTFKQVAKGTSGGISPAGTASAFAGSLLIAFFAYIFQPDLLAGILVALAGLLGSLFDSLLGATVQVVYWCEVCAKETEKTPLHGCGNNTRWLRGLHWLNNDWVNLGCTLSAPLILVLLRLLAG